MYWPRHRPQLTGISTESVDCGVRATQMGLDAITEGKVVPSVPRIRELGGMGDGPTNYHEWDEVVDELGGRQLGFSGQRTNSWSEWNDHVVNGGWAIAAVHYGRMRKLLPGKTGSLSFTGYHAILFGGLRRLAGGNQVRSFDSLLDGRYRGCPDGPVWVPKWKVREAAEVVGTKEGTGGIFGLLLHPDTVLEPGDPGAPLPVPPEFDTLPDILSDLVELAATSTDPLQARQLGLSVDALRLLLGVQGNPEADDATPVAAGIAV